MRGQRGPPLKSLLEEHNPESTRTVFHLGVDEDVTYYAFTCRKCEIVAIRGYTITCSWRYTKPSLLIV